MKLVNFLVIFLLVGGILGSEIDVLEFKNFGWADKIDWSSPFEVGDELSYVGFTVDTVNWNRVIKVGIQPSCALGPCNLVGNFSYDRLPIPGTNREDWHLRSIQVDKEHGDQILTILVPANMSLFGGFGIKSGEIGKKGSFQYSVWDSDYNLHLMATQKWVSEDYHFYLPGQEAHFVIEIPKNSEFLYAGIEVQSPDVSVEFRFPAESATKRYEAFEMCYFGSSPDDVDNLVPALNEEEHCKKEGVVHGEDAFVMMPLLDNGPHGVIVWVKSATAGDITIHYKFADQKPKTASAISLAALPLVSAFAGKTLAGNANAESPPVQAITAGTTYELAFAGPEFTSRHFTYTMPKGQYISPMVIEVEKEEDDAFALCYTSQGQGTSRLTGRPLNAPVCVARQSTHVLQTQTSITLDGGYYERQPLIEGRTYLFTLSPYKADYSGSVKISFKFDVCPAGMGGWACETTLGVIKPFHQSALVGLQAGERFAYAFERPPASLHGSRHQWGRRSLNISVSEGEVSYDLDYLFPYSQQKDDRYSWNNIAPGKPYAQVKDVTFYGVEFLTLVGIKNDTHTTFGFDYLCPQEGCSRGSPGSTCLDSGSCKCAPEWHGQACEEHVTAKAVVDNETLHIDIGDNLVELVMFRIETKMTYWAFSLYQPADATATQTEAWVALMRFPLNGPVPPDSYTPEGEVFHRDLQKFDTNFTYVVPFPELGDYYLTVWGDFGGSVVDFYPITLPETNPHGHHPGPDYGMLLIFLAVFLIVAGILFFRKRGDSLTGRQRTYEMLDEVVKAASDTTVSESGRGSVR